MSSCVFITAAKWLLMYAETELISKLLSKSTKKEPNSEWVISDRYSVKFRVKSKKTAKLKNWGYSQRKLTTNWVNWRFGTSQFTPKCSDVLIMHNEHRKNLLLCFYIRPMQKFPAFSQISGVVFFLRITYHQKCL